MSTKNYITGTTPGSLAAGDDARLNAVAANTTALAKLTLNPTAVKTANYAANAQDLVLCNAVTSALTVTLPTAPADGTLVEVKKLDASSNAVTMVTGGSDTFSIGTTSAALAIQGQAATVRYSMNGTMWIGINDAMPLAAMDARYLTATNAANNYIAKPSGGLDGQVALKSGTGSVWASIGGMVTTPPVGGYVGPSGVSGTGYGTQNVGRVSFFPFWIGSTPWTADAFRTKISAARSGGTVVRKFALYPDAGGYPDTTVITRIATATIDDSVTTSNNGGDFIFTNGPVVLTPGLYWGATFYYESTASTSKANLFVITDISYSLPTDTNNAPDAKVRSLVVDGYTDLPTNKITQSSFVSGKDNSTAHFFLRRSA